MLKILHTSDVHLGMKFTSYEGDVRETLIEARFDCLARLIQLANKEKCDLFVVAGDLFGGVSVPNRDIVRAAQIFAEFEGALVTVLPGNHDYVAPDETALWNVMKDKGGDNLLILRDPKPVDLTNHGVDAILYPCPCTAKHSTTNAVGWVDGCQRNSKVRHHIGIAHGSLAGVSPDFEANYYPMTREELTALPVDFWLLGHTHLRYPATLGVNDTVFFAGTPEPDGFDCDHPGSAWIHDVDDAGKLRSTALNTGKYAFRHDEATVANTDDVDALKTRYAAEQNRRLLLKLKLNGRLAEEVYARLPAVREDVKKNVFWLALDDAAVTRQITLADINAHFTQGSFPYRLLTKLAQDGNDCEALQEAHRLITEVQE